MAGVVTGRSERTKPASHPLVLAWLTKMGGVLLLALLQGACGHTEPQPVTLSYFRLGWLAQPDELSSAAPLLRQFTQLTGVRLSNVPVPESTLDQVEISHRLLANGSGPDVLGVDLIWSGVLEPDLIDLRPYLGPEIALLEPGLLTSYTVNGKLVAIPYGTQLGALEYRTDLLREYGYHHPPNTWDELEGMAERIQAGERAKGNKNFWGYVWQGAQAEALTCNAIEWQAAAGAGQILENDRTISVNNPAAIRAWQRAKQWIGRISPPSVLAYRESDSSHVFDAGDAAFHRMWATVSLTPGPKSRLMHLRSSLVLNRTGYARLPGWTAGPTSTLGGGGLAISAHSTHPQEAIALVRYLMRSEMQSSKILENAPDSQLKQPAIYDLPSVTPSSQDPGGEVVRRPSDVSGSKYELVAKAYISAVHSALSGERPAAKAASELEKQLAVITGFGTGPPKRAQ